MMMTMSVCLCTSCDSTCQLIYPNCSDYTESAHPTNSSLSSYVCNTCTDSLTPFSAKYYKQNDQIKFLCDKSIRIDCHLQEICKAEFPDCKRVVVRKYDYTDKNRYYCQKCTEGLYYPGEQISSSTQDVKGLCGVSGLVHVMIALCLIMVLV